MANQIQVKQGIKSNLPILASGEFGFVTDEKEVYIGTGSSNIQILTENDLTGGTGINYGSGIISTKDSEIDHNSLNNYTSDEHFIKSAITTLYQPDGTSLVTTDDTGSVNISGNLSANFFDTGTFTEGNEPPAETGRTFYSDYKDTLSYYNSKGQQIDIGQTVHLGAKNDSGGTLYKGDPVYIKGSTGDKPTVDLAKADSLATLHSVGVVSNESAANNEDVDVIFSGCVSGFDTSSWSAGDILYISADNAGTYTATPPSSPNYQHKAAVVIRSNSSAGNIYVISQFKDQIGTIEEAQDAVADALSSQFSYDDNVPLIDLPYIHNIMSAGRLWGGELTDNGDGTITVSAGEGLIKGEYATIGDSNVPTSLHEGQGSKLTVVSWSETVVTLYHDAYNFIYYDVDAGGIDVTTDFYGISSTRDFTVGRVFLEGTTNAIIRLCGTNLWNFNRRVQLFGEEKFPITRATGLMVGNPSGLYISITSGVLWAELVNRFTTSEIDTSGTDTFMYWYQDGSGGFVQVTGNNEIDNLHYDDGSGTLAELTANRYGVHWIYMGHDSTPHVVYGRNDYKLDGASQARAPGDIPGRLASYSTLLGKVIVQKSEPTLYSIESAFNTQFTTSGVTDHGDLSGLTDRTDHPWAVAYSDTDVSTADWVLDEDDLVSNDNTKVATQQSIKAYVDSGVSTTDDIDSHLFGGTGINYSSGTISTDDANIDHNSLNNFVSNEHIDHSNVSIFAGTGLSGSGNITTDITISLDANIGTLNNVNTDTFTAGQLLIYDNTNSEFVNSTLTAGTGIDITNSDGSISISTDDANIDHNSLNNYTADEHFVKSDIYKLYQPDGTNPFVYTDDGGTLHIDGDIVQNGDTYKTHVEELYSEKDLIITRDGATAGLSTGEISGLNVKLYDGTNDLLFGTDQSGYFKVGKLESLQILATREDSPNNTSIPFWNDTEKRFDTSSDLVWDGNLKVSGNAVATESWVTSNFNNYSHPSHPGDDASVDTGTLSGATVISDLDFNVTTDSEGHVTDANATFATRNLTLGDLGYTGDSDANNYGDSDVDAHLSGGTGISYSSGTITNNDTGSDAVSSHETTYNHNNFLTSVSYNDLGGTPSDRITAGDNLSWDGETLNVVDVVSEISVLEDGTTISNDVTGINFTALGDAAVSVTSDTDGVATVEFSVAASIDVSEEGTTVVSKVRDINFIGGNNISISVAGDTNGVANVKVAAQDPTLTKYVVESDEEFVIPNKYQYIVHDPDVNGTITVEEGGELVVL